MSAVYLGLGSNLGNRDSNLAKALEALAQRMVIEKISSVYETEPLGYLEQPWFLNMVCSGTTGLNPFELLSFAKGIEGRLGRLVSFPNAPRPIDIDILFYNGQIIETADLIIPHPRIAERAFVLIPLSEIAPELIHPAKDQSVKALLSWITDSKKVRKWGNVSSIGAKTF
ncbi:MAG: 2-amino-4-hydroxy-6-hydroxymethyldihydropteridine diphosphokinase [Dehalococcoidia bacterium]